MTDDRPCDFGTVARQRRAWAPPQVAELTFTRYRMSDLRGIVCDAYRVTVQQILGPGRSKKLVDARAELAYRLSAAFPGYNQDRRSKDYVSLALIGRVVGRSSWAVRNLLARHCDEHGLASPHVGADLVTERRYKIQNMRGMRK